jgi:hypothetical protein
MAVAPARTVGQVEGAMVAFGPIGEDNRDGVVACRQQRLEQRGRGLVGPVQVIEDEAERPDPPESAYQPVGGVEGLLLHAVRAQLAYPALELGLERQPQHAGDERVSIVRVLAERRGDGGA